MPQRFSVFLTCGRWHMIQLCPINTFNQPITEELEGAQSGTLPKWFEAAAVSKNGVTSG